MMTSPEIDQAQHEMDHPSPEMTPHACLRCDDYEFEVEVGSDDYTCPICGSDNAVEAL